MKALLNVTLLGILFSFPIIAQGQGVGTGASFRGPVGLQTYSLRDQIAKDGAKAFDFVKEQGFKIVEIGLAPGSHYGMTPEDLRDTLKKHGIKPVAALTGLDYILNNPDDAAKNAEFFGLKYVGVAAFGHTPPFDEAQALKIAADFNKAGKLLKDRGLQFYYHNHGYEFYPYKDDLTLFDLLMEKTDPDLVKYQMDVMWTVFPGQDPVKLMKRYPGRWVSMHLKDLRKGVEGNLSGGTPPTNDVPLGTGQTDYPALLKAAQEVGVKHYFIEDESPDVLTQIPQSLEFLSNVKFPKENRRLFRGQRAGRIGGLFGR